MKKLILLSVLALSLVQAKPMLTNETKTMLKEAKQEIGVVNVKELNSLINKNKTVVLDIRTPGEWQNGVIKSDKLVKVARGFLELQYTKKILSKYNKNDKIVVYCGVEPRAILASKTLKDLGFTDVSYLKGGYFNWRDSGFETSE